MLATMAALSKSWLEVNQIEFLVEDLQTTEHSRELAPLSESVGANFGQLRAQMLVIAEER